MIKKTGTIIASMLLAITHFGQNPLKHFTDAFDIHYDSKQPVIHYLLSIDTADLSSFSIEMRLRNIPDTFRVAMVTHPEYDDRFWRFVEDMQVNTKTGSGNMVREDSALWRIGIQGGEAVIRYKIHLPKPEEGERPSWTPFLSSSGGLVGGPHSFMYVVGATLAPSYVTLKVPGNWPIATGLQSTSDPATFFAPSVAVLVDCPFLTGKFSQWSFFVDGVPHRVVYWLSPGSKTIDGARLVSSLQKLVEQASSLFGRLPYREYTFLFQDNAYGSLEHSNSVTVGILASHLEEYFTDYIGEIAHEYFHTWNLVRIRPQEYGDVDYKKPPLSKGLWFSEGLTMFYADLLLRRADLPVEDSTRERHLERLIRRYYNNPGNTKFSPEKVSMAEYGPQGMLGDYMASSHLQGELIGTMLDLFMRDYSNGGLSIDQIMRRMMIKFSAAKGFSGNDIEQLFASAGIRTFFANCIRDNEEIDFNYYLHLIGLRYKLTWKPAVNNEGKPAADLHMYPWVKPGETAVRIMITDPSGCWGKAGLHTGDIITAINGTKINERDDLWKTLRVMKMGDTVNVELRKPAGISLTRVIVSGYRQPDVKIETIQGATEKQKRLYQAWARSN